MYEADDTTSRLSGQLFGPGAACIDRVLNENALSFFTLRDEVPSSSARRAEYLFARSLGFCEACGLFGKSLDLYHDFVACPRCISRLGRDTGYAGMTSRRAGLVETAIERGRLLVVTAAVIDDGRGSFLVAERDRSAHGGPVWEFPGGKAEAGEGLRNCIVREIDEELGLGLRDPAPFVAVTHEYPGFVIRLCAFRATVPEGDVVLRVHRRARLLPLDELASVDLAAADRLVLEALRGQSAAHRPGG